MQYQPSFNLEDVEQTAMIKKFRLTATSDNHGGILLPHQDITLKITSPTKLKSINSNFDDNASHSSLVPWHTDKDGEIFIRSNIHDLNLKFSTELQYPTSMKLTGQANWNNNIVKLQAECSSDQVEVYFPCIL